MAAAHQDSPGIGLVIVTYRAGGFIADCLESVLATGHPGLKIVVVDNASADDTVEVVRHWASASEPRLRADWPFPASHRAPRPVDFVECGAQGPADGRLGSVTLVHAGGNLGFAGGVNRGLELLLADPGIDLFWVLNPDTVVEPQAPAAFAEAARKAGRFALIGGRVVFFAEPGRVQIDGGRIGRLTARTAAVNFGAPREALPPEAASLDFITGSSMAASRAFIERAGLMEEGYFLYFEELDWQLRRGDLPLVVAPDAVVRHHAGATIGSGGRGKPGAFAIWFTCRNTMRFVARWFPWRLPLAYLFAWVRMARNLDGTLVQALAFLTGLHQLPPPAGVRRVLPEADWRRILSARRPR